MVITPTFVPGAIDAHIGDLGRYIALATERAASASDPSLIWPGGYDYGGGLPDVLWLRGGKVAVNLELDSYDFEWDWPIEVHEVRAVLRVPGEEPTMVAARIVDGSPGTFILNLPDRDVRGELVLDVVASDRCLTYTSSGIGQVSVVRSAIVDACPTKRASITAYAEALRDPPVQVAGVEPETYTMSYFGIWEPFFVAADGHPFVSWDRASPAATGPAGGKLIVAGGSPDVQLVSFSAEFYRRSAVLDWPEKQPKVVARRSPRIQADGTVLLGLPDEPGRYVATIAYTWESPCLQGDTFQVLSVDAT